MALKRKFSEEKTCRSGPVAIINKKQSPLKEIHSSVGYGDIIWAKLDGHPWWPAIAINGDDLKREDARVGYSWVVWFGENRFSEVSRVCEFKENFSKYNTSRFKRRTLAVKEALQEMCQRANITVDESQLFPLTEVNFYVEKENVTLSCLGPEISFALKQKIQNLSSIEPTVDTDDIGESALDLVRNGEVPIESICVACVKMNKPIKMQHPVIEGGLCEECTNYLKESIFSVSDQDGYYTNCILCALGYGKFVYCDNLECNRCYCHECIEMLVSKEALDNVINSTPWNCYLCSEYNADIFGLIKVKKEEMTKNVYEMFKPEKTTELDSAFFPTERKAITVLSLFDGIGTGRIVLDSLGFDVQSYYACEIDKDSINVSKINLSDKIMYLGDVKDLTEEKLKNIGPVDLLIGGSPCNDISKANPLRKGLYDTSGTGILFFHFFRILKTVEELNRERQTPLFWFYENVASMPKEFKDIICRFFESEPALIDAKFFSPQIRPRFFWGNIPRLHVKLPDYVLEAKFHLDDYLIKGGLNRKANVKTLRTITTKSNSLKQNIPGGYPVSMDGCGVSISITELEKIFGFPPHYTDSFNLSVTNRQKLIGKAWSVQVAKFIVEPLKMFYKLVPNGSEKLY